MDNTDKQDNISTDLKLILTLVLSKRTGNHGLYLGLNSYLRRVLYEINW